VSMFVSRNKTYAFLNVPYKHKNFVSNWLYNHPSTDFRVRDNRYGS
jgi:hypothetical protein